VTLALVSTLAKILVLPPFNAFALGLAGWFARRRFPRAGRLLILLGVLALFAQSISACSRLMLHALERYPPLDEAHFASDAGAIVILGAEAYWAPEYGKPTIGGTTLERTRYGAWLQRATGVPVLTAGGPIPPSREPLGEVMARALRDEFKVPVKWVEVKSRNTFENAKYSAEILRAEGVRKVYLVTSASHMWRSKTAFEAMGLEVVPAPTDFTPPLDPELGDFVPRAEYIKESSTALYEWFGMVWYWVAYY